MSRAPAAWATCVLETEGYRGRAETTRRSYEKATNRLGGVSSLAQFVSFLAKFQGHVNNMS